MHKKDANMKRRDFIKLSANAALLLAWAGLGTPLQAGSTASTPKTVINLMLDGGPDFRYLIVPAYGSADADDSYAAKFWLSRASLWGTSTADGLKQAYSEHYDDITISGVKCGILKSCGWLKSEISAGRVAIINSVVGSTNRDHHHSQLMIERGSLEANAHNLDASGWAGRAAKSLGGNVLSLTPSVRLICNGPHPTNPKGHDNSCVISNYYSRDAGLYNYDTQGDIDSGKHNYVWSDKAKLSRALSSYYLSKRLSVPTGSPYSKPMEHEKKLREFGALLSDRLKSVPIPDAISNLDEKDHVNELDSSRFARQILALYDSYATQDIVSMRLASMEYTGWDSHKNLKTQIGPKLEDMFGTNKGFDALITELDALKSDIYTNSVIVISGEFGRQHKSNGDHGNDHGRGNSVLVIGGSVNGGLYGDPFPESQKDDLLVKNKDIEGKTSMLKVYSSILDWQKSGLGDEVFGDLSAHIVESGVDLGSMFA